MTFPNIAISNLISISIEKKTFFFDRTIANCNSSITVNELRIHLGYEEKLVRYKCIESCLSILSSFNFQ